METAGKGSTKSPSSSVQAVPHSRWRHIGTYIVSFSSALRPVNDGLVWPFSLGEFLVEGPRLAESTHWRCDVAPGNVHGRFTAPTVLKFGRSSSSSASAANLIDRVSGVCVAH
jgi:hypothetical protein